MLKIVFNRYAKMGIDLETVEVRRRRDGSRLFIPSYCCFVVTLHCLMKCKMCYIWKNTEESLSDLSIQEWKNVVSALGGFFNTKHDIILSGGEPLLKKDILDLVYFSTKAGYKISLDTNAYLIDEELARKIRDSGLWRVCISLDSIDENKHNFLRGKEDSYYRVMKAIEYLNKFCPSVGINIQTVIMEQNLDELVKLAHWVGEDERLDYIYFQVIIRPFGASVDEKWFIDSGYNFLWPKDINKVRIAIDDLIELKNINPKIVNTQSQFRTFQVYFRDPLHFAKEVNCTVGNRDININPTGDVYLCFSQDPIGNVRTDSVEKIWYSKKAAKIRKEINKCRKYCHFLLNCSPDERV